MAVYCESHTGVGYVAGCEGCRRAQRTYKAGPGGDANRRYCAAQRAAWQRLASIYQDQYRALLMEELDARTPRAAVEEPAG